MIYEKFDFVEDLFSDLGDYKQYVIDNSLHSLMGVDLDAYGAVTEKKIFSPYHNVDRNLQEAFVPELDDLCRLHFLVRSRKVTTILEFGLGKSTVIFDDSLVKNENDCNAFVEKNLRRTNRFKCFSVDNNEIWIEEVKSNYSTTHVVYHHSSLEMGVFNERICTYYQSLPNVCPDFIYLDGPDQFSANGNIRGVTTDHPDRLPMAADILTVEHFLLPGTLIVTDGRTANARFLKSNLQRDWIYCHDSNADQHYFELSEEPLGIYNKTQIDFCLGDAFFRRLQLRVDKN